MRLRDYILGQKYVLRSSLPLDQVKARINRASGSSFWPFDDGIVGGLFFGRLRLTSQSSVFDYNAKPRLAGRVEKDLGGTLFRLNYRGPTWGIVFLALWYVVLGFISLNLLGAYVTNDPGLNREAIPVVLIMIPLFSVLPIVFHKFGTNNSEYELQEMLDFLREEAEASAVPASGDERAAYRHR